MAKRKWRWAALIVPPLLMLVMGSALALRLTRGEAHPETSLIEQARRSLLRGDGIDAEVKLRAALLQGAARAEIAPFMGQAYLAQGDRSRARQWLQTGAFAPSTAGEGWRALGFLERIDGNLEASARAYDKALTIRPDDASLWVELGRLRYVAGDHGRAIAAAERAITLQPDDVRGLEFQGQLVRDRSGLTAALPWFERAIAAAPSDVSALLEYAATLGELGRASECLQITRRALELGSGNPRAYYLQALIAARAGRYPLARALLIRTGGRLDDRPGVQLLKGSLELASGNPGAAEEALEAVLRARPDHRAAKEMLLRAIAMSGRHRYATMRFADEIAGGGASPYMMTAVARAFEALGDRKAAGELLERAARPPAFSLRVQASAGRLGGMLRAGRGQAALALAEAALRRAPGSYDARSVAGDVQLALGHGKKAQARYALASEIRMPDSLLERRLAAYAMAGDRSGAEALLQAYLRQNPTSRAAMRLAAELASRSGDPDSARAALLRLRADGREQDVTLLSNLAAAETAMENPGAAREAAWRAYRLQRSSPVAAEALAMAYAASPRHAAMVRALRAKAGLVGNKPAAASPPGALPP
ncbi:tetratricopeptide repeat protein [Novosphingobium panipatense]|uniref:Tfp pilus assembly protein PilF n=1 Tax=Novosphingobium panipatense TaxID=428991 RepID=A0ABY1Q0Y4_9SPHN|nr:tetratricopeptide repeat protein [Novosphingobium panipatense]SMP55940.1 Tfp pilus assembly protein PilF [Novosphingobium panipatense]